MTMKKSPLTAALMIALLSLSGLLTAKEKFGKVSSEELQMTAFAPMPEAEAVILFDCVEMQIRDDFVLVSKRHYRIKILSEPGKEWANCRIPFYHEGEKIRNLKAHSVQPAGKKTELKGKDIFEEESGKLKYKVFAIPGVEVGSVIEVTYELESPYLAHLDPWYFQDEAYTVYSEVSVRIPPGFTYNTFFYNTVDLEPEINDRVAPGRKIRQYTWRMNDVLPLGDEPFMRSREDYRAQMQFQLINFRNQYANVNYLKSWKEINEQLQKTYADFLQNSKASEELAKQLSAGITSGEDIVKALYNHVTREIETGERGSLFTDTKPQDILSNHKASGLEKNLLLMQMIRSLGIDAGPLLIATRNYKRVSPNLPNLLQFNYVLAYAKTGDEILVMDTRNKQVPFKLLPENSLVERGFLVNDAEGSWIDIDTPRALNLLNCETNATLDEEGTLTAKASLRFEGYHGVSARGRLQEDDGEAYMKDLLEERFGNVEIDSVKVAARNNPDEPLLIESVFTVNGFAQTSGDKIYLGIPHFSGYKENPFKSKRRTFPVEFPYFRSANENITISLPEGYTAEEIPAPIRAGEKKLRYSLSWKVEDNTLTIRRNQARNQLIFRPSQYPDLRGFFDFVVQSDLTTVVLSQNTVPAGN